MITDLFLNRYDSLGESISNSFFVQLFNLFSSVEVGIRKGLTEKIDNFSYSSSANEHIRIISDAQKKLCNELGYISLEKTEYLNMHAYYQPEKIFKGYIFDESIDQLEKFSLLEILFRDAETLLRQEINFLEQRIPEDEQKSAEIKELSKQKNTNFHNNFEERLKKDIPLLESKKATLNLISEIICQRLRQHNLPFTYHNGYFQSSEDPIIENEVEKPFWPILADPKYKNVETDIIEAIDLYDTNGRDPAFYAAKALESMIKIICDEKSFSTGKEKGASDFLSHLNSKANGQMIANDEKDELTSMFRIRNAYGGHGPGSAKMPTLNHVQTRRYINSCMVWIHSLVQRL